MVTLTISCVLKCLVCFLQLKSFYSGTVFGEETGEFDFDRFPWVQNEFSLEVGAGKEECLYQKLQDGINLHVSYEVLRGGDRNVNAFLKGPYNVIIDSRINNPSGALRGQQQKQTSINSVELSINEVLKHQAVTRMQLIKDWYLITGNNIYVQYWSILHCVIFITTSVFQVYFVRRLFRSTNVTPTAKPRA